MDQSAFRKRLFVIAGGGACVLLVLVWLFIKHNLSARGFGVAGLIWWVAMFAVLYRFIRSQQRVAEDIRRNQIASGVPPQAIDRDRCITNIRGMKRLIAVFAVFLGFGLFSTQGEAVMPRTIGATVDVFFLAVCVQSLMRSQKKLKGLPADGASQSSDPK
jgi:predicted secreted protein